MQWNELWDFRIDVMKTDVRLDDTASPRMPRFWMLDNDRRQLKSPLKRRLGFYLQQSR
jgi:hypothetical protein